jgi:hypothetical protein
MFRSVLEFTCKSAHHDRRDLALKQRAKERFPFSIATGWKRHRSRTFGNAAQRREVSQFACADPGGIRKQKKPGQMAGLPGFITPHAVSATDRP